MSAPLRIVVTGAAGFIGSHVAEALVELGHDVTGLDNYLTGRPENFPCVSWDISRGIYYPADVIVHAAASYDDGTRWLRDISTNVTGAVHVCRRRPERIVYFQTALCYGHDPYGGRKPVPLLTDQPLAPDNSYAISKTAGESYLLNSGISTVSLRLANIFGPRNLSGPIPTFYKRLSEKKKCVITDSRRDFVFIGDLLPVALAAVEGKGEGVYHVSSGRDYPISQTYSAVSDAMGVDGEVEFIPRPSGDSPAILLDPSLTEAEFDSRPTVSLKDGIAEAVDWYETHGVERTFTHLALKG